MTLSNQQLLDLKMHLGRSQEDFTLDQVLARIALDPLKEAQLKTNIQSASDAFDAIVAAENAVDELESGGGAVFNHRRKILIREKTYQRYISELIRITLHPNIDRGGTGQPGSTTGWDAGV